MIKTILLIDSNEIDNFIHYKVLKDYGAETITMFTDTEPALSYLLKTEVKYQLILIDAYFQQMDGFEFIRQFIASDLHKVQGRICFLSACLSPRDLMELLRKKIQFIQKPLTPESLKVLQEM